MHSSARELSEGHVLKSGSDDSPRPAAGVRLGIERRSGKEARHQRASAIVSADTARRLAELASETGIEMRLILIGAWAVILSRYAAEQTVTFGVVARSAARATALYPLPFTVRVPPDVRLRAWFTELAALDRRSLAGLAELRGATEFGSELPPFHTAIAFYESQAVSSTTLRSAISLQAPLMIEASAEDGGLSLEARFDEETYGRPSIDALLGHLRAVLTGIAEGIEQRLEDLRLLDDGELTRVVVDFNQTTTPFPARETIAELFASQARLTPEATALVFAGRLVSYAELDAASNRIAQVLMAGGVGPNIVVGLCVERSIEMLYGMLGILKAGGAYVGFDPGAPPERISFMLEQSGAPFVLTLARLVAALPATSARVLCLDRDFDSVVDEEPRDVMRAASSEDLAYVSYTSGSTGEPKGVAVSNRGVVRLVRNTNYCEFGAGEVFLQLAPISFDASTFEVWGALLNGATLVIMPPGAPTLEELAAALRAHGVTILWLTAGLFQLMVDAQLEALAGVRQVLTGGDVVSPTHARKLLEAAPTLRLVNGYGPTENTTFTCCYRVTLEEPIGRPLPVGRPISNTRVYILDDRLEPQPIGVPGEIYAGGAGVAKGYLGRPELTRERFIPDPFGDPSDLLYRTGDIGRYMPDGTVEFMGRRDRQIKIRGFRVEPGEVESAILRCTGVREAVVTVVDAGARKRLVAYFVRERDSAITPSEILRFVRSSLPAYMVPAELVEIAALPLTDNGKVDLQALPAPSLSLANDTAGREPSEVELRLMRIWESVLGRAPSNVEQNFFDLGGDSLAATQLAHLIGRDFGVKLPLSVTFEAPSLEGMAARIVHGGSQVSEPIGVLAHASEDRYEPFPLTDIQQAYFFGRTGGFELGNVSCHLYLEFTSVIEDIERLNDALCRLIERHDMLRAVVGTDGQQRVLPNVTKYRIRVRDLRSLDEAAVRRQIEEARAEASHAVFEPGNWPLFDVRALRLPDGKLRLQLSFDLLILDGFSFLILFSEWERFYRDPECSDEPLSFTFRDYALAEAQRKESTSYARARKYWQERVPLLPAGPELPLAKRPSQITKPTFERERSRLPRVDWERLKRRAQREKLTPSVLLCTAYSEVLRAWSKADRFTLNLTLFNRLPVHPQVDKLIGDFTTLTLLEVSAPSGSFLERAQRLQQQLWQDLEHREDGGIEVLRDVSKQRGLGSAARMPVVFTSLLRDFSAWSWLGELDYSITQTPQVWLDHVAMEDGGSLIFHWDSVAGLFPRGLMSDMFAAYCGLLRWLADDATDWSSEMPSLLPEHQLQLRHEINDTRAALPFELLHGGFARQAAARPTHPAVVSAGETLSYGELDALSNRIARQLVGLGVAPGKLVAVLMEKGWEQVAAVLAILKAGGAYVPISASLPAARIQSLLEIGAHDIVLTQPWLEAGIPSSSVAKLCVSRHAFQDHSASALTCSATPHDLAYVIFTSGSTGKPKGVMIAHGAASNTCHDLIQRFQILPSDRIFGISSLDFDLSVFDVFGTLAAGATLVLPRSGSERDPSHWLDIVSSAGVTLWNSVPALMEMFVEYANSLDEPLPASLRLVWLSGDWIPIDLPDRIRHRRPGVELVSMGGATEASIWSIIYPIASLDPEWSSIPYGKPLRNQTFHVLDGRGEARPTWVEGDLYIGGIGLAIGYFKDAEKTEAAFITHPRTGERLYRTGDLGRYLPDGNIEFLGRRDAQVKVRGHRIELGEIETTLLQDGRVERAVATVFGQRDSDRSLAAYVVLKRDTVRNEKDSPYRSIPGATIREPSARTTFKLSQRGVRNDVTGREVIFQRTDTVHDVKPFTRRRTFRRFLERSVALSELGDLLGSLRQARVRGQVLPKYQYASAGGLYPVQVYCYSRRVDGLPGGLYYYHPIDDRLRLLSDGPELEETAFPLEDRRLLAESAFALFLVADLAAIRPLYGELAERFCWMEAGIISHLLETRAPDRELGLCQLGGLDFSGVGARLRLSDQHLYLHCLLGGAIDPVWMEEGVPEPAAVASEGGRDALSLELRALLRDKLPEYMVPRSITVLESLPMSANGKVDRAALPPPVFDLPHMEPRLALPANKQEHALQEIFSEVLGLSRVDVSANFFDLGGNSVQMMSVYQRIRAQFAREVPIVELFRAPSVRALSLLMRGQLNSRESGRERGRRRQRLQEVHGDRGNSDD